MASSLDKEVITPPVKRKENLKQRAYLNSLTSILDYVISQLTGFIVSPFIVNGLGSSMYGVWQMLGQMTGYAKVADTRATQVLKWTVAKKKDIADEDELRSDVSSALAVTVFILPLVLLAGGIVSWYAPYITNAEAEYHNLIRITCSLLILSLVVSKLFDLYESVLRGMNLSYKRMGLRASVVVVGGGLKVWVLYMGFGLIGLSVVQVLISFIIGITYYFVVRKSVSWFGYGRTSLAKIKDFSKVSGWYLADTGANLLLSNSDKILLGFLAGPVVVTYYTLTLFLPTAIQGIINRVVMGVVPGIGKLLGLQEYDKVTRVLSSINNITFLLVTASGVTIILLNDSFLRAWVGDGFFAGNIANTLIMLITVQDTFIKHDSYIISATLQLKEKVFLTLVAGISFLLAGYFLINQWDIVGLCISTLIAKFILYNGQQYILRSKIQYKPSGSFANRLKPLAFSLVLLLGAGYISPLINPLGILELAGLAPIVFGLTFVLFYFLGLQSSQREDLVQLIKSIKYFKSE